MTKRAARITLADKLILARVGRGGGFFPFVEATA